VPIITSAITSESRMEDLNNTCHVLRPLNLPAWCHFVFNLGKFAAVKLVLWDDVTWGPVKGVVAYFMFHSKYYTAECRPCTNAIRCLSR